MARNPGTRHRFHLFYLPTMLLLAGCALPVPLQIASWAVDGLSFITTRKSLADHGLSLIARRDCAIWRGIVGETICITDDAGIIAVATASPRTDVNGTTRRNSVPLPAPAANFTSIHQPADNGLVTADEDVGDIATFVTASGAAEPAFKESGSAQLNLPPPLTIVPPPPPPPARTEKAAQVADRFYVIGQFRRASSARRMAGRYARLGPEVMETKDRDGRVFRVMVGPFSLDRRDQVKGHILRTGINNVSIARMDGSERFIARYYSIASGAGGTPNPETVGKLHVEVLKSASFTRYKEALLHFFGV